MTDIELRQLTPAGDRRDVRDDEQPGLIITIRRSGLKQFNVRYRFHGEQRRLILGDYPGLSLKDARKKARGALTAIDNGQDPATDQQDAKRARTDTVEVLAKEYMDEHAHKFKKRPEDDQRTFNADILPKWRDRSVRELTRRDVRDLLKPITKRAPVMANRVLSLVSKMLNFAVDNDWIEANPAARMKKPSPENSRTRVLNEEEMRRVWRLFHHLPTTADKPAPGRSRAKGDETDPVCPISPVLADIMKLELLTLQRGGEIRQMRWADLSLDTGWWTIPGIHTKNGNAHHVYLLPQAVAIIRAHRPTEKKDRREYVFTGRGGAAIDRDRLKKASAPVARALGVAFRGHDLRRTASSFMGAAGVKREDISYVLNHVDGGPRATRVYDLYSRDREKRVALDAWAAVFAAILAA